MIKAIIFDFDGTIVNIDLLTFLCEIVGKEKESEELFQAYLIKDFFEIIPIIEKLNYK